MKKVNLYILASLILGVLYLPLEAASNNQSYTRDTHSPSHQNPQEEEEEDDEEDEYYEILNRDQIDNSNTLAIPFDDSEIEDEEEIDRDEGKDVFHLPHSR